VNKLVMMGAMGSGKSTQAGLLATAYDLVRIGVGDIFRWHVASHTKLGARVRRAVNEGALVSDEVVEQVVRQRLDEHDWNYGFVLDGFPRDRRQAEFLLESCDLDGVVHVDIPDAVVLMRVMSRRLCVSCGLDYNLILHRPAIAHVCDVCGGRLMTRPGDSAEALELRLGEYHARTRPVVELFRSRGLVVDVDGVRSPEEVQRAIRTALMLPDPPVSRAAERALVS
jgi:adenylate kinase